MLYEFEVSDDTMKAAKNICCTKGKDAVDQTTVSDGLRNFAWVARS